MIVQVVAVKGQLMMIVMLVEVVVFVLAQHVEVVEKIATKMNY